MACEDCGGTIKAARSDSRYCSNACRQRAYRGRQRRARLTPERRAEILADLEAMAATFTDSHQSVTAISRNAETT